MVEKADFGKASVLVAITVTATLIATLTAVCAWGFSAGQITSRLERCELDVNKAVLTAQNNRDDIIAIKKDVERIPGIEKKLDHLIMIGGNTHDVNPIR